MNMISNLLILTLFFASCTLEDDIKPGPNNPPVNETRISYLALGDSYTIGQNVPEEDRFPVQLTAQLNAAEWEVDDLKIIARTGWTTGELQAGIEAENIEGNAYDLVTLLIGVNNQYRGNSIEVYKVEFEELLDQAILFANGDPDRVVVLSIPDYSVTPFGQARPNPEETAQEIDAFNQAQLLIAAEKNVAFIDITPISREADEKPELIASDGLHPSGEMYARWVNLMLPTVKEKLRR